MSEHSTKSIFILYHDESKTINALFNGKIITGLIGKVPIVFISSSPAENNHARSLHYKADELLIEPVSSHEIRKTINNLGSFIQKCDRPNLVVGDLVLDRTSLTVTLRINAELPLFPIQVRILELLMLSPGRVFTRQEILNSVWSADGPVDDRTVDVSIGRIRDALKHKVKIDPIRTVRSVGYAFNEHFGEMGSLPKKGHAIKRAL